MDMTPLKRIWDNGDDDYVMVVYNGYAKPCCVVSCPREVDFITWHRTPENPKASACVWIVCRADLPEMAH